MKQILYLTLFLVLITSCASDSSETTETTSSNALDNIAITWELMNNPTTDGTTAKAAFTIKNKGNAALSDDWTLYFNQSPRTIVASEGGTVAHVVGDFYKLSLKEGATIAAGENTVIYYEMNGPMIKEADGPAGLYFATDDSKTTAVSDYLILPFTHPAQLNRSAGDKVPIYTPAWQYEQNTALSQLSPDKLLNIIPTPQTIKKGGTSVVIDGGTLINYAPELAQEGLFLASAIGSKLNTTMSATSPNSVGIITMQLDESLGKAEAYTLDISKEKGIIIKGSDAAGAFYGVQSLLALLPIEGFKEKVDGLEVPAISIQDAPRFAYRGMHLDVARNFNDKKAVQKLLDAMAFYKLNVLHLHLTEDEAWRLEIQELPELTQVGARRGFTLDSKEHLPSAYGSGANPDDAASHGNGYYSRADYKEIIKYAHDRHIEVIPEINVPGHARAAIKAMEARSRKLGEDTYLLSDPDDASEYMSVQSYPDNVVCVCRESVYTFYETVVDDIIEMHKEAGVPLTAIHTGGDEVPAGVWEKSPLCEKLIAENASVSSTKDLSTYFLGRINAIVSERGLVTAGWEEVAMKKQDKGYIPHPDFTTKNVRPYVWQNLWGLQDLGNQLANAGYPVVLCNVTNFYFDLAYNKDPSEPGLYWGGFIDTKKAYDAMPFDILTSTNIDPMGNPLSPDASMERLTAKGKANILGIQGQLWSETIKGGEMLEYYYMPKLLGLAERAWAKQATKAQLETNWNTFANTIAQRELPRFSHLFGGYNYRIPTPGAIIKDGKLYANMSLPGFAIRYTVDGSAPTVESPLYEAGVAVKGTTQVAAFDSSGRSSKVVTLKGN